MTSIHHRKAARCRRAFTILEMLVAMTVLGVGLAVSVRLAGAMVRSKHEAQHRQCALSEADNWLERLTAVPWDELTPERAAEHRLSPAAAAQLPGGQLRIDIDAVAERPPAKRVLVEVQWRDVRGAPLAPVRLAAWVYPRDADSTGNE